MDVQVDGELIRSERERRAWSQEPLASAAGIGVRTIQRIEATGVASYESARAISAVLEIPLDELRRKQPTANVADSSVAANPAVSRASSALRVTVRWLGAAAAVAVLAGIAGFSLLKDYQRVRVLRTVEQWVTQPGPSAEANNR